MDQPVKLTLPTFAPTGAAKSLADQVYARVRAGIVRGQLAPGTRLLELELAEQMGTSQGPVREALQRLEREGLVTKQARSATFVTPISIDEMYALFSVRSVIEGFAARRTAVRFNSAYDSKLASLVEHMNAAGLAGDMFALTEADLQFHRQIMLWAENAALLRAWNPLYSQIQRFIVQNHADHFPELTQISETHQPVLDALRSKNPDDAAQAIQDHIMLIWSHTRPKEQAETSSQE